MLDRILAALAKDLYERVEVDLTEAYVDGSHAGAKRRSSCWANSTRQGDQDHGGGQTAMVFLSPSGLRVVSAVKRSSSSKRFAADS